MERSDGVMLTKGELIRHLARYVNECETAKQAADQLGVSPQYLADVIKGRREPGAKILKSIGYFRQVFYVKEQVDKP